MATLASLEAAPRGHERTTDQALAPPSVPLLTSPAPHSAASSSAGLAEADASVLSLVSHNSRDVARLRLSDGQGRPLSTR